ncbi:MAG: hypothetical protein Q4E28_03310 [Clostridia bacterium]|nr:hypothetical protein [Clostridia bacterium]
MIWKIALILLIILIIFTIIKKIAKAWIKIIIVIIEIVFVLFIASKLVFPLLDMPEPTGTNKVKTDMVYYVNETKYSDMATDGNAREIPIYVYYPENLKDGEHPLLIFSHGSFGIGSSNETLYSELASRGYVVMSLSHPHHSFFTKLSSGKTVFVDSTFFKEVVSSKGVKEIDKNLKDLNRWVDPRIEDINFVLDKILDKREDNIYERKIDTKQIILSGHSLGGSAALAVGKQRAENIKALVILESPFVKDIVAIDDNKYIFNKDEYPRPILHIYSDSLWGKMSEITTYSLNQELIDAGNRKFVNVHIEGVGHIGLTDMSLASPFLTNLIDGGLDKKKGEEALVEINKAVVDFLDNLSE